MSLREYQRVWIKHHGAILKDKDGRSMEIHHIDGNHANNDISNLKMVTLKEHYDIHYSQGDWGACYLISIRMKMSPEERSELSKKVQKEMIANGTHPFLGPTLNLKRVADGTHPFLGGEIPRKVQRERVKNGTHQFCDSKYQRQVNLDRVANGTHVFLDGTIATKNNLDRVKNGTHPSQLTRICEYCERNVSLMAYGRYHGEKCKRKNR